MSTPAVGRAAPTPEPEIAPPVRAEAPQAPIERDPGNLADAVERTMASVVSIQIDGNVHGAGVLYDERGLLLTNYHVVKSVLASPGANRLGAATDRITVKFVNGRELPARVVAADGDEDIAVLRLFPADSAETFEAASMGESEALRIGESVFSIGSPVGLEHTVSTGIVSAVDRTDILPKRQLPLIQLDASINVGNSGGPLFNFHGELVGITVARSHRAQGIGFAIPIDHVGAVLRALKKGEAQRSGVIGVQLAVSDIVEKKLADLEYTTGLYVETVYEGPAERAGMKPGDVVVEIRGKRYDGLGQGRPGREAFLLHFGQVVRSVLPGEKLALTVVREGKTLPLEVEVEAATETRQARIDSDVILGLVLEEATEVPTVERVSPGSEVAGYQGTSILQKAEITHILGQKVSTVTELGSALADIRGWSQAGRGRTISVSFRREDRGTFTVSNFPLTVRE